MVTVKESCSKLSQKAEKTLLTNCYRSKTLSHCQPCRNPSAFDESLKLNELGCIDEIHFALNQSLQVFIVLNLGTKTFAN